MLIIVSNPLSTFLSSPVAGKSALLMIKDMINEQMPCQVVPWWTGPIFSLKETTKIHTHTHTPWEEAEAKGLRLFGCCHGSAFWMSQCVHVLMCNLQGVLPAEPKPEWQFCDLLMKTTRSGSNDNNNRQRNKKKRTNTLLVGTAGTFLNRRMMITAARLVSGVWWWC